MNVMQLVKGEERWTMIDNHTWDMILGKSGRLPGKLAPEIVELAKSKGYEFVDTDPQSNYPDALDEYRKEMDENGWEYGEDDEEQDHRDAEGLIVLGFLHGEVELDGQRPAGFKDFSEKVLCQ